MTEPSPMPWRKARSLRVGWWLIFTAEDGCIAELGSEADADLIVTAVNAQDALRRENEALRGALAEWPLEDDPIYSVSSDDLKIHLVVTVGQIKRLRALLSTEEVP